MLTLLAASFRPVALAEEGDRAYTVHVLTQIAEPVLSALAQEKLRTSLPVHSWEKDRAAYAPLEAFARTFAGLAPWLELGPSETEEGKLRARFIDLTVRALGHGTDPSSPDFLNFRQGGQALVDTAFLAQGLLRAPKQIWERLDATQRAHVLTALESSRKLKPGENNWLLFSAIIEAALWQLKGECEPPRIEYAVNRHMEWYLGDGTYGDGREWHWDYYNSFVIQPMLLAVMDVCAVKQHALGALRPKVIARARRYAVVQERMISPEGTFPVLGRSSAYRFGAFQQLANAALRHELPPELEPGTVRAALTAVIRRTMEMPGTLDENGWLQVGAVGHQPSIREGYISTGSLYLCTEGMVHLGLPETDPFWTEPGKPWSQKRIWSGADLAPDSSYKEPK